MRTSSDRSPAGTRKALAALLKLNQPTRVACPHRLGRHLIRTCRSTQAYPDGELRLPEIRGGRLVVEQAPCVWAPGHAGAHKTPDGRTWS